VSWHDGVKSVTTMHLEDLICGSCGEYVLDGAVQCSCGDRLCGACFKSFSKWVVDFVY